MGDTAQDLHIRTEQVINELVFLFPYFAMQGPSSQLGKNSNVTSDKHLFLVRNILCLEAMGMCQILQHLDSSQCFQIPWSSASATLPGP